MSKALAAVVADKAGEWFSLENTWLTSFNDEAVKRLYVALASNTTIHDLTAECVNGAVSDTGAAHLARGIARSGITWFGCGEEWDLSAGVEVGFERAVAANIIRRVAANDPALMKITLDNGFHDGDMTALCVALRGNACLRTITVYRGCHVGCDGWRELAATMVKSGIEELGSVGYLSPDLSEVRRVQTQPIWAEIQIIGAANKACKLVQDESIAANRPFQRLLLASTHTWDSAAQPLAADLMLIVLRHLDDSKTSPFSHAGTQLPGDGAGFEWHRQGQAVSSLSSWKRERTW